MLKLPELRMKVFHQGLILVGVPLLIEMVLIGSLAMLLFEADKQRARENRYRQFSAQGARIMALCYETPYLLISSVQLGNARFRGAFDKNLEQITDLRKNLTELAKGDSLLGKPMHDVEDSLDAYMQMMGGMGSATKSGSAMALLSELPKFEQKYNSSKGAALFRMAEMVQMGERSLAETERRIKRLRELQSIILSAGLIANLGVGAALLLFYRRRIMLRLSVIMANTLNLAERKPLAAPLNGYDEIAQLDRAFHAMDRQLKATAERERALFENASDVICILTEDNRFSKINPACERLWKYSPLALLNSSLLELIAEENIGDFHEAVAAARSAEEAVSVELKIRTARLDVQETLWSIYWSASESALFCVVHDITEQKSNEKMKQQFLSMISSDLKRPLSTISTLLSNLIDSSRESLSKLACDKLQVANKNVARLLGLVNDLLQIADMDSGRLEIKKEQCSLGELMKRSIQDVEGLAHKLAVRVELRGGEGDCFVDPDRIIQVLVNLLSNALKFSPQGGLVILESNRTGDMLEVKVIDQGRGVPAAYREAIFEKFKQVEAADGKRKSGTGLGLPICKQIIEEHGGRIGVDSEEGQGSTFWFAVPADETASIKMKALKSSQLETLPVNETKTTPSPNLSGTSKQPALRKKKKQLNLAQKGILLVGVPILFELLFVGALSVQLRGTDILREKEMKQRQIASYTSQLLQQYIHAALLLSSDRTRENWTAFESGYKKLLQIRRDLAYLVKDNKVAYQHYLHVEELIKKTDYFFQNALKVMGPEFDRKKYEKAIEGRSLLLPTTAGIARRLQRLADDAASREFKPVLVAEQRSRQAAVLLFGLGANVLVSLLLALYFSKDLTSRLATLADNADRFAREESLNDEMPGTDEIAQLDRIFHRISDELALAHKKERAVFDNSKELICVLDSQGKVLSSNPACEKLLGYSKADFLEQSILNLTVEDDKEDTRNKLLSDYKNDSINFENRVVREDHTPVYMLWSASRASDGQQIFCVAHDISSRKELEQLKQEFLAMVSHDLRTPLTSIVGIAKLVSAGAFGQPEQVVLDAMQSIVLEADHLLELINDLLDIEKLEAGKMQLVLEQVSLKELLLKAAENISESRRPELELGVLKEELTLSADRDRLLQGLCNIINFAALQEGAEAVPRLMLRQTESNVDLLLEVQGARISAKELERLFDRFRDLSECDSLSSHGGGLALPIAKNIIDAHGGKIAVHSSEHGIVFCVSLPLSREEQLLSVNVKTAT